MKTLYLSGAISHNPNYRQDFEAAHKALSEAGYTVISPLHICNNRWSWRKCMKRCIKVLLMCNAVAFIPTSIYSRGVELEIHIAKDLNMPVKTVEYWISHKGDK